MCRPDGFVFRSAWCLFMNSTSTSKFPRTRCLLFSFFLLSHVNDVMFFVSNPWTPQNFMQIYKSKVFAFTFYVCQILWEIEGDIGTLEEALDKFTCSEINASGGGVSLTFCLLHPFHCIVIYCQCVIHNFFVIVGVYYKVNVMKSLKVISMVIHYSSLFSLFYPHHH